MVIRSVGAVSCAKVVSVLYVAIGLIVGAVISMASMAGGWATDSPGMAGFGAAIGVLAIVALPLIYGGIGFVATLIAAWLYNAASSIVGGIEIDVQ
jgi:hypothetical protein